MSEIHFDTAGGRAAGEDSAKADEGWSELLGPLLAGARARGVADALELLGMAAVLIDSTGGVLHASGRAVRALSPLVRIVEGQLVGSDPGTNATLGILIAGAVEADTVEDPQGARFYDAEGRVRLFVRAVRFPAGQGSVPQLLRSILIVNEIEF